MELGRSSSSNRLKSVKAAASLSVLYLEQIHIQIQKHTYTQNVTLHTYNFVFLLRVEGLSLGGWGRFGLGLGPACGTLTGGAPRFRDRATQESGYVETYLNDSNLSKPYSGYSVDNDVLCLLCITVPQK